VLSKDGDGKALLAHFSRMWELNRNFFYEIDIDYQNHVRNVFWADVAGLLVNILGMPSSLTLPT